MSGLLPPCPAGGGFNVQTISCPLHVLASARRKLRATMREVAGQAAIDRDYRSFCWVGPVQIRRFVELVRQQPDIMSLNSGPFAHLPLIVSEAIASHSDENPSVLLLGIMPVNRPFRNDPTAPVDWVWLNPAEAVK